MREMTTFSLSLGKVSFTSRFVSSSNSLPAPSRVRTFCFETVKDITCRLHSSLGSFVASQISLRVTSFCLLNIMRARHWYVETTKVCLLGKHLQLISTWPMVYIHLSFRPLCFEL